MLDVRCIVLFSARVDVVAFPVFGNSAWEYVVGAVVAMCGPNTLSHQARLVQYPYFSYPAWRVGTYV